MNEGVIFVQTAYYLYTPHLARSRAPKYLDKCMRANMRACVCMCQNEGECMREERERKRETDREGVMWYRFR